MFYGNGSSGNHGCEAIVRGTIILLKNEPFSFLLQSNDISEDSRYGLDLLLSIKPAKSKIPHDLKFLKAYLKMKLIHSYVEMDGLYYLPGIRDVSDKTTIALSIGGDNYCYNGTEIYPWLNREYHRHGIKTILWGCSVEPSLISSATYNKDFALYDAIVARETITYNALRQVNDRTVLAPDPAFFMSPVACPLDSRFSAGNIIGINATPTIISNEKTTGIAYENYKQLISYILNETDLSIALIPHVVWKHVSDLSVHENLYRDFDCSDRIIMVDDHTAPELKYIISQCRFFIGARTHATIAAYSTGVPTLVLGYSVKAKGIARDLFDDETGYVLPVQDLQTPTDLTNAFLALYEKSDQLRTHLSSRLPDYLKNGENAIAVLKEVAASK